MELRCRAHNRDGSCNNTAQYITVTGCDQYHLEETPLCAKHSILWESHIYAARPTPLAMLLCNHCHGKIIECETTFLNRVTVKWMRRYITNTTTINILEEIQI